VAYGKQALPTPRYSAGRTIQNTLKLVQQSAKAPGSVTSYLAPVFPNVRAGKALQGRPEHVATPEDENFARSLHKHMNVAMIDYISSEDATRIYDVYFPKSVGNDSRDGGPVGPNWHYIVPCLTFVLLYWILAGAQKYQDEEFDGWLRAGGCARCQRGLCKGAEKSRKKGDGEGGDATDAEGEHGIGEHQAGRDAGMSAAETKDQQGGSPRPTIAITTTPVAVGEGDVELAITAGAAAAAGGVLGTSGTPGQHRAASAIQRRIRRSLIKLKFAEPQQDVTELFASREAALASIRTEYRHGRSHSRSGHYRTLFANGPEFEGLAEETHQMHRVMLKQARSLDTLREMVERLARSWAEEETYKASATVGM
jgi:hypothetical protein